MERDDPWADLSGGGRPEVVGERRPCPNPLCRCTHTNGCEYGWMPARPRVVAMMGQPDVQVSYPQVTPCPTCYPEKQALVGESRAAWLHRITHRAMS